MTVAYTVAYAHLLVAGVDVAYGPVGGVGLTVGHLSTDIIGVLVAGWSGVAMVGQALERWRWEFYAVAALLGSMLAYNTLDWLVVLFVRGGALRGASVTSAVLWLLVARLISLWMFNRRTTEVRLAARSL